jgi:hypothetical protein
MQCAHVVHYEVSMLDTHVGVVFNVLFLNFNIQNNTLQAFMSHTTLSLLIRSGLLNGLKFNIKKISIFGLIKGGIYWYIPRFV